MRLHADVLGAGEAGVLLLHGWRCDRTSMTALAERLAVSLRVVNVDMRGHGLSDGGPETLAYGCRDVVDDLRAAAREHGLLRPLVVGHSLGAKFLLAAAGAEPGWTRGVVLLDPSIDEAPDYVATRRAELDLSDYEDLFRRRMDRMFAPETDPADRRWLSEMMAGTPLPAARASLAAGDELDVAGALRDCPCPVLYVGASDPRVGADRVLELNPAAWYGRVVGSGHFVQVDATDQVLAMVQRFAGVRAG